MTARRANMVGLHQRTAVVAVDCCGALEEVVGATHIAA
jgi:hypothetical protein